MQPRSLLAVVSTLAFVLLAGCSHQSTPNAVGEASPFLSANKASVSCRKYVVDPPDQIEILAPGIAELHRQKQTVDMAGEVTFNLIGAIYVAGKTPEQVSETLRDAIRKYYTNPDIKVIVTANSKFYYVLGPGAANPGVRPFTGRDYVVKALAQAGFNEGGWPGKVHLSRPSKQATAIIDFDAIAEDGILTQNYLIEEGDILYVPRTPLAVWRNFWDNVIPVAAAPNQVAAAGAPLK